MSERNAKLTRRYLKTFTGEHRIAAGKLVRSAWLGARTADQRGQLAAQMRRHLTQHGAR